MHPFPLVFKIGPDNFPKYPIDYAYIFKNMSIEDDTLAKVFQNINWEDHINITEKKLQ